MLGLASSNIVYNVLYYPLLRQCNKAIYNCLFNTIKHVVKKDPLTLQTHIT
jgi:hypothetical protein